MPRFWYIILNWLALLLVLVVNYLAVSLPINGQTPAEVSAKYPNLFVPAGFTFSIWGIIYLLHFLHAAYSTYILMHPVRSENAVGILTKKLNPLFWLACLFNCGWLMAWHYNYAGLSVFVMGGLFMVLLQAFRIISKTEKTLNLGYFEHVSLETPFIIYFSWINVAILANLSAWLVSTGWPTNEMWNWLSSCIMITWATGVGVWLSLSWQRPAFTAVIAWALIGIYANHAETNQYVGNFALAGIVLCGISAVIAFWHKRKLLVRASAQSE